MAQGAPHSSRAAGPQAPSSPLAAFRPQWAKPRSTLRDPAMRLLYLLAACAWVYVIIRAARLSFTIDEAATYGFFHGDRRFVDSANNHWLNTIALSRSQHYFGQSEFALRLPNVAAFAIYTSAILVILAQVRKAAARFFGFVLLVGNPFLLEFFSLARGYGLGLAFTAVALAGLIAIRPNGSPKIFVARVALVSVAGILAVYASFTALDVILPTLGIVVIDHFIDVRRAARQLHKVAFATALGIASMAMLALIPAVHHLMALERRGELYYGGNRGLLPDTFTSLLNATTYRYSFPTRGTHWTTVAQLLFVAVLAAGFCWAIIRARDPAGRLGDVQRIGLVVISSIVAIQVQASWRGTLYPIDRAALVFLLPVGLFATFVIADMTTAVDRSKARKATFTLIGATTVLVANFAAHANVNRTLIWSFDASSRQVMNEVMALQQRADTSARPTALDPWTLISGFPRNEALNYYRLRFHLTWLKPILRTEVNVPADLYYVHETEVAGLPMATRLLKSFPLTHTQLRVPLDSPLAH